MFVILVRFRRNAKFFWQIFEKYSNIKFHENPSSGRRVGRRGRTDRRTGTTKLIVAFPNFVNAPEKKEQNMLKVLSAFLFHDVKFVQIWPAPTLTYFCVSPFLRGSQQDGSLFSPSSLFLVTVLHHLSPFEQPFPPLHHRRSYQRRFRSFPGAFRSTPVVNLCCGQIIWGLWEKRCISLS